MLQSLKSKSLDLNPTLPLYAYSLLYFDVAIAFEVNFCSFLFVHQLKLSRPKQSPKVGAAINVNNKVGGYPSSKPSAVTTLGNFNDDLMMRTVKPSDWDLDGLGKHSVVCSLS